MVYPVAMQMALITPADFSFRETLQAHGWRALLPFSWQEETATLERVERLDNGRVVLLRVHEEGDGLRITVSEEADRDEVVAKVRRMLQLDLPMDAFHAFCAEHPKLCHVPARRQGRMLVSPTLWEDTCKVILTTNTTWTQTRLMVRRIVEAYGSPLSEEASARTAPPIENPMPRAFPTPEQIAAVPFEEFAATAKLGYRNAALHSLAIEISTGRTDLETLTDPTLSATELWKRLLALRGVGPYAASCLMIYLGRYERVNVDSWARMIVGKELGRPVTDQEAHQFFAPYGEWRALAYHFYPWNHEEPAY